MANGIEEPMDIKMWCIGNEMDGPWQVGHMSPEEYAGAVDKVAHAMKLAESGLELVACGSSGAYMPTFGTWEKTVLTKLTRISTSSPAMPTTSTAAIKPGPPPPCRTSWPLPKT